MATHFFFPSQVSRVRVRMNLLQRAHWRSVGGPPKNWIGSYSGSFIDLALPHICNFERSRETNPRSNHLERNMGDKDRRQAESQAFQMEDQLGGGHNIPDQLEHGWKTKNRRQETDKPSEADTVSQTKAHTKKAWRTQTVIAILIRIMSRTKISPNWLDVELWHARDVIFLFGWRKSFKSLDFPICIFANQDFELRLLFGNNSVSWTACILVNNYTVDWLMHIHIKINMRIRSILYVFNLSCVVFLFHTMWEKGSSMKLFTHLDRQCRNIQILSAGAPPPKRSNHEPVFYLLMGSTELVDQHRSALPTSRPPHPLGWALRCPAAGSSKRRARRERAASKRGWPDLSGSSPPTPAFSITRKNNILLPSWLVHKNTTSTSMPILIFCGEKRPPMKVCQPRPRPWGSPTEPS